MSKNAIVTGIVLFMHCLVLGQASGTIALRYSTSGYGHETVQPVMDTVPSMKAEMSVTDAGSLSYMIPIEVMPGLNNFQPNLALVYNSSAGDGMAGWGWNISGLSSITNGGTSKLIDGLTRGPQYSSDDPFYLDGERLLTTDGTNFTTEKYSRIKITRFPSVSAEFNFIVQYPDGKVAKYKRTGSGQYYISLLKDALDNEIHYTYTIEHHTVYLNTISYGATDVSADKFKITFNYTTRTIPVKAYRNGLYYINDKYLSEIVVSSTYLTANNGLYRKYVLYHDDILAGKTKRLVKVTVQNETGYSLRPLKFEYNDSDATTIEFQESSNYGLGAAKGLGSVTIGDFYGTGKLVPLYEIKTNDQSYVIRGEYGSSYGNIYGPYDKTRKLFTGKSLINNEISENDQLISVSVDYQGEGAMLTDLLTFRIKDLVSGSEKIITSTLPGGKSHDAPPDNPYDGTWIESAGTYRDEIERELIPGDYNNDGLIDVLIVERADLNRPRSMYFMEIGKLAAGTQYPVILTGDNITDDHEENFYPVEFDGDGVPEIMRVDKDQKTYTVYKFNSQYNYLSPIESAHDANLWDYSDKTPLIFGDFNGDGITDFMTPKKLYSLEGSTAAKELKKMEADQLIWWQYIGTGFNFVATQKDYTEQRLAYIRPSQRNIIKKSSMWSKFWSGTPDSYEYTEYGSSSIFAVDINNDGKTDLVSFRKFGKAKYADSGVLAQTTITSLNEFVIPAHLDDHLNPIADEIVNSTLANKMFFHISTIDANGDPELYNLDDAISLEGQKISPISLPFVNTDINHLDTYSSEITIYDPLVAKQYRYTAANDDFIEGRLRQVNNGSPIVQKIEYRPMVEKYNTSNENSYTTTSLGLAYPYYTHKNNGLYYLVTKIHSLFDGKILTKEYRYQNAIQHLDGKGFIGFQKTFTSDTYESQISSTGKYVIKNFFQGLFWTVKTYDPILENALISVTYGSLNPNSVFSKSTYTNQYFDKGNHHYLILSTLESTLDYLKNTTVSKSYQYDTGGDLLLTQSITNYNGEAARIEKFFYKPESASGEHFFFGKIEHLENTLSRGADTFSTKEEQSYNEDGSLLQTKKYGNDTPPIVTDYEYWPYHQVKTVTTSTQDIAPAVTSYDYDVTHRFVTSVTSPDGLVGTTNVNALGRTLSELSPLGHTTSYKYDRWGNVKEITDYLGKKTAIKKITMPGGLEGDYGISNKREGGAESIAIYDMFDRQIRSKTQSLNGQWVVTDVEYDILGRKIKTSEPHFDGDQVLWNTTQYDDLGRIIQQKSFSNKIVNTCYEGSKVTVDDNVKMIAEWSDATGNVIRHKDSGGEISYKYFPNGALKETDYDGMKTKIQIDGWGNKKRLEDPTAGTYNYTYDNLSRLKTETNPKGGVTTYTYDDIGRLYTENTISASEDTNVQKTYFYDPTTKLPTVISGNYNGKNYTYTTFYNDPFYRITGKKEETPDFTYETTTTYDEYGRSETVQLKTTLQTPSYVTQSNVKNIYDANGILIRQDDTGGTTPSVIWEVNTANAHGQTTQMHYGNGYVLTTDYSPSNLMLEHINQQRNGNPVIDITFNYDAQRGLLTDRNNTLFAKNEHYDYDDLDRLLQESLNGEINNSYTYDARGRMTSNTEVGKYSYASQNYTLQSINFNANGNTMNSNRGLAQIQYNAFRAPTEIILDGKDHISYDYSILGSRSAAYYGTMSATASARPNRKFYSSDNAIEVVAEGGSTKIITYVTGDPYSANYIKVDVVTGAEPSSNNYYLHRDSQGTILAITKADAIGSIVEQRYFDAWGNLKNAKVNGNAYTPNAMGWVSQLMLDRGYTGHEHLKSVGLINMNARIYDPVLRRFMSPDNYVQDTKNTQCYNRFGYVVNNPLLYTDVSGNVFGIDDAIIIAIAVSVAMNAVNNIVHDVPFWYGMGKAAVIGAASGAISFEIGEIATSAFNCATMSVGKALFEAGLHGFTGGFISEIDGGTFASGFAAGAASALISASVQGLSEGGEKVDDDGFKSNFGTRNVTLTKAAMIASGGLAGGVSSSIAGGDFWTGARQGVITAGLNEVAHMALEENPVKNEAVNDDDYESLTPQQKIDRTIEENSKINKQYNRVKAKESTYHVDYVDYLGSDDGETFFNADQSVINTEGMYTAIFRGAFKNPDYLANTILHELGHGYSVASGFYSHNFNLYNTSGSKVFSDIPKWIDELYATQFANHWGGYTIHTATYNANAGALNQSIAPVKSIKFWSY